MRQYRVKGYNRESGAPKNEIVDAEDADQAARASGLVVESVKPYVPPAKLPDVPEYPGLLLTSKAIRWVALIAAPIYLLVRLIGGYLQFFSSNYERVAEVTTFGGVTGYIVETAFFLIALVLLYTLGECVGAFRDLVINSHQ